MFKHILIPTDGSPASARAIAAGIKLAAKLDARITGFYAAPPVTPPVFKHGRGRDYVPLDQYAEVVRHAAGKRLGAIEAAAKAAGVRYRGISVTSDYPAEEILKAAKAQKCDLIVMASHGHHGFAAVLLGSETQKVLAHATIPVLVHR